jgi:hypothetical protein
MRFASLKPEWLRAAVLVAFLAAAATGAAKSEVTFFGLTFPDRVAGAEIEASTDNEKTTPGLGYRVTYRQPDWTIDVYIYDLGRRSIPEDVRSDVLKSQLRQAHRDILEVQRSGVYSRVKLTRSHVMRDGGGRARLDCLDFIYVHETAGPVDSFLCLAGWHNKFVKFRLTSPRHAGSETEAKRFLDAWIGILWP